MAVSNVSRSSSSSSIYGSRSSNIISGLASGMDTESMIEGMVSGIKTKIDTQKQKQQILLWQQEAYRSGRPRPACRARGASQWIPG